VLSRMSRKQIVTRIDTSARDLIDAIAAKRRVTPSVIARILLEDSVRELAELTGGRQDGAQPGELAEADRDGARP
jgi:hypothetical protein